MPSKRLPILHDLGPWLRKSREDALFSLDEVAALTAEMGQKIPKSTLSRVEAGEYDPGLLRYHLLIHLYETSAQEGQEVALQELSQLGIIDPDSVEEPD